MKTKAEFCIDCGNPETTERRRCKECNLIYNREKVRNYYERLKKSGKKRKRYGIINCCICKEEMIRNRPNQVAHGRCKKNDNIIDYNKNKRDKTGMMLGKRIVVDLGIKIPKGIIVHHVDENPINNSYKNLVIMSSENHGRLHKFLKEQWVINKGVYGDKLDSVWKKILIKLNFVWMKNSKIKLITLNTNSDLSKIEIDNSKIYFLKNASVA